jgi:hypothetical protein
MKTEVGQVSARCDVVLRLPPEGLQGVAATDGPRVVRDAGQQPGFRLES